MGLILTARKCTEGPGPPSLSPSGGPLSLKMMIPVWVGSASAFGSDYVCLLRSRGALCSHPMTEALVARQQPKHIIEMNPYNGMSLRRCSHSIGSSATMISQRGLPGAVDDAGVNGA